MLSLLSPDFLASTLDRLWRGALDRRPGYPNTCSLLPSFACS